MPLSAVAYLGSHFLSFLGNGILAVAPSRPESGLQVRWPGGLAGRGRAGLSGFLAFGASPSGYGVAPGDRCIAKASLWLAPWSVSEPVIQDARTVIGDVHHDRRPDRT